jgi:hypothetical protein
MRSLTAIGMKAIVSFILLYVILGLAYNMSFSRVLFITVVLGAISYIIGDRIILPRTNNTIATSVDFALAFSLIWGMNPYSMANHHLLLFWSSFFGALAITVFELFFHTYLMKTVKREEHHVNYRPSSLRYQTEASEELHPHLDKDTDKK